MTKFKRISTSILALIISTLLLGVFLSNKNNSVAKADENNSSLTNSGGLASNNFEEIMKEKNDPNYFTPSSQKDYYKSLKTNYIKVNKLIGASTKLGGVPIYPVNVNYYVRVKSIKHYDGKYWLLLDNQDKYVTNNYEYISANKKYVKFISKDVFNSIAFVGDPRGYENGAYPNIPVPGIISYATYIRDYSAGEKAQHATGGLRTKKAQKVYSNRSKKTSLQLAHYFKGKEIHATKYYVKRAKYFNKLFGLKGKYKLQNFVNRLVG